MTYPIGHTRPQYEIYHMPPLEARVLANGGAAILRVLASASIDGWVPITTINRQCGGGNCGAIAGLVDLGWIEQHLARRLDTYRLTDAGWAQIGGKPGWM